MTPWATRLLVTNGAMFLITKTFPGLEWALAFVPVLTPVRPWSLITYMFLHADLWHLLFNMLGLFFFGPRLEVRLGGRRFLTLYLVSGVAGALLSFVTPHKAIVGASAAVFGVFLGYALYWPHERVYIWGLLPVPARVLVVILTLLSLYGGFTAGGGIAHFAHLGGFLGGLLYLKWSDRRTPAAQFRARAVPEPRSATISDLNRWRRIRPETMHPVNRAEYERLLRKIQEEGPDRLTHAERAFLDRFAEYSGDQPS